MADIAVMGHGVVGSGVMEVLLSTGEHQKACQKEVRVSIS